MFDAEEVLDRMYKNLNFSGGMAGIGQFRAIGEALEEVKKDTDLLKDQGWTVERITEGLRKRGFKSEPTLSLIEDEVI